MKPEQLGKKAELGEEAYLLAEWIDRRIREQPNPLESRIAIEQLLLSWAKRITEEAMQENPWRKLLEEHLRTCPGAPRIVEKTMEKTVEKKP